MLDQIVRQKEPGLLRAVEHLSKGEIARGIAARFTSRAELRKLQTSSSASKPSPGTMQRNRRTR
jgi:hypothetical protein